MKQSKTQSTTICLLSCICCILFFFISCNNPNSLKLWDTSGTAYSICLPENPHELETKAAQELQHYIQLISGHELPIINHASEKGIYVGSNLKQGKAHQVDYWEENEQLMISGGDPQSTLYAVYTFLENELGCRFYSPEVEHIPQLSAFGVDQSLNYSYSPPITTRTVHSRLFYENTDFADKLKVTHEAFPYYVPNARVHTFHRFVPATKYYDTHPAYYALRNGKRIPTQLCLTNEAVYQVVRDTVEAMLEEYPEADVISVSQDDNTQYCQCDACEAIHKSEESPSATMIQFVNRIAREFPDKQISTLAYQYTRKAPKTFVPEPNVLITLCSIECDRSAPIAQKCEDFTQDLIAWGEKTNNIRIWDYTTQFTNFLSPFPNIHTLKPNLELFRDNQAKWVFEQHSSHPSELFELRSYLTAKLLWNPDVDQDSIQEDFLQGYYEEAAPFIGEYIKTIHEELAKDSSFFLFLYGDPSQGFDSFLKPELLAYYDSLYDQAAKAVSTKSEVFKRVHAARLSVDYAMLEYAKTDLTGVIASSKEAGFSIDDRLNRFKQTTKDQGIELMNEMRYSVAEYIDLYAKTLERAAKPNLATNKPVNLLTQPKKYAKEDPQTLTDGAFGSSSFYANWLGFEGNDLEAIIDLEEVKEVNEINAGFLQVVNHIVFFPEEVSYYGSIDGSNFQLLSRIKNQTPLNKNSKINDIQYFTTVLKPQQIRYLKIKARSMKVAPTWHHGAGLPSWIFVDEVEVR